MFTSLRIFYFLLFIFFLHLLTLSIYVIYTNQVTIPKLEQRQISDSLKIDSLQSFIPNLKARVDTVYDILNNEIRPDLTFNSDKVDSLDDYRQLLNRRTAPLLHYKE
jgi:hypothetical protein